MRILVSILICFSINSLTAQVKFTEEIVNEQLVEEINKLRESEGLPELLPDEILDAAAFDQAEYILKLGKITHEQDQSKKKGLLDRLLYYEGTFDQAGENAAMVTIGSKEQIELGGERVEINTELKAVRAALTSWLDEEDGRLNLLDPQFYRVGTSVLIDENDELILVAILATEPYLAPSGYKLDANLYGIDRYHESICKNFLESHPSLPQLFSDVLKVENGEVFIEYHSLPFMEEILSSSGDALAVDIVQNNQFNCGEGNRLAPTEIADGFLMVPTKKGKLIAYNLAKDKGEVKLSLGELPGFYDSKTSELNLVIIKDGHFCETVPYNKIVTKNTKGFKQPYLFAGVQDTSLFQWKDSTVVEFRQSDNWEEELKGVLRMLKLMNYNFSAIDINQLVSPIDKPIDEEKIRLLVKEASGSDVSVWFKSTIAWKEFNEFQKGSFFELETKGMDTIGKINYLDSAANEDTALKSNLNKLNRIELVVQGEATLSTDFTKEQKIEILEFLARHAKVEPALFLQVDLIKAVQKGELKKSEIPIADPKQKKYTLPLINNQIILAAESGETNYGGNGFYLAFLELYLIDRKQTEISFNTHIAKLETWAKSMKNIDGIDGLENWEDEFKKLANSSIPDSAFSKGMLNFYIVAADYYYEKEKFDKRKKSLDAIMKWQPKAKLTDSELLELAQYLCFQDQFSRAIELLIPLVKQEMVNREILFYFLQIAIYDKEQVSQSMYFEKLELVQLLYPKEFCLLFSKEKMGIQMLKSPEVKKLFCEQCN